MSATRPFYGKLQVHDDPDNLVWSINGTLGPGTAILVYRLGPSPVPHNDFVTGQLQSETATPTNPRGLRNCYLAQSPIGNAAVACYGIGDASLATQFLYQNGPNPTLVAWDGPSGSGGFGLWAAQMGGKFWGWTVSSTKPEQYKYSMIIAAPSAVHARTYLGGACPQGADYTWCDLGGEDWTALSMRGARFAGADLTGTNFAGSKMAGADFQGVAGLSGANLTNTDLTGARFVGVDLRGMDFSGALLRGADFTGAQLDGATFADTGEQACDLTGVNFSVARSITGARFATGLTDANFAGMALTGVDFTGAVMPGTVFRGCDLRPASFASPPKFSTDPAHLTDLSQATISFAQIGKTWAFMNLVGTRITGMPTSPPDLTGLNAQSSLMMNWDLHGYNLYNANLSHADLRGARLSDCNFTQAVMTGVQLQADDTYQGAVLSDSQMMDADLTGANLSGTILDGVFLWGSKATVSAAAVRGTSFANAYLTGLDFTSVDQNQCKGVMFSGACLVNVKFTGTNLTALGTQAVHMAKACLQGADFTGATLHNADLTDAAVDLNPGTITVTIQDGWPAGQVMTFAVTYSQGTTGITKATDSSTTCPKGSGGPCGGDLLVSPNAPTSWRPVGTKAATGADAPG